MLVTRKRGERVFEEEVILTTNIIPLLVASAESIHCGVLDRLSFPQPQSIQIAT